ncbi:sensor domain-containing protein [Mycobacterium sp. NPDC048908]|uniref:sensor domain-containing protein n=1 Tax=Mycobacterium sp. NPDC048908 TaxID=3364292 RepID=UPI00371DB13E
MLTACGGGAASGASAPPKSVPDTVLTASLLTADELNTVMGASGMTPHTPVAQMTDNRNLLPNLNCLGVWQVNQSSIYESSNWKSVRQQLVRAPDSEQWNFLVVQSIVSYRTADAARKFLIESADRWSKCTNHTLNIQLNGQTLPKWVSGELTKTDTELAIPYTRGTGDQTRSCQHSLSLVANLILDVQACRPQQQAAVGDAVAVAGKITTKLPH